jgi:hypothetical protein
MGTRSLTFVYDENDRRIIKMYAQYDGYPLGHGRNLAKFLSSIEEVTNGISVGETRKTANGMGCLAAQLVANFKTEVGGYYLHPTDDVDHWQEYEYSIYPDRVEVKQTYDNDVIFNGTWQDFESFCNTSED